MSENSFYNVLMLNENLTTNRTTHCVELFFSFLYSFKILLLFLCDFKNSTKTLLELRENFVMLRGIK